MQELLQKISGAFSEVYCKENNNVYKIGQVDCWKNNIEDFAKLYYSLNDEDSKKTFIKLFRLYIGVSLSRSNLEIFSLFGSDYWSELESKAYNNINKAVSNDYLLDRIETYLLKGYEYKNICKAEKGDYVLDCGAYTGNTSVYFSELVGEEGKVFCFEAMPQTYLKLNNNVSRYKNIYSYNYAICEKEKKVNFTENATPGSRICDNKKEVNTIEIQGISIDTFINKNNIEKVDFIKMDIEGAELRALDGCIETCKKFSPKLAICIYHKIDDWVTIPRKILELNKNYVFYMKHNSNRLHETVLFAVCLPKEKKDIKIDKREMNAILRKWKKFDCVYFIKRCLVYAACNGFIRTFKNILKKVFKLRTYKI